MNDSSFRKEALSFIDDWAKPLLQVPTSNKQQSSRATEERDDQGSCSYDELQSPRTSGQWGRTFDPLFSPRIITYPQTVRAREDSGALVRPSAGWLDQPLYAPEHCWLRLNENRPQRLRECVFDYFYTQLLLNS
jgi:hypothetical protein